MIDQDKKNQIRNFFYFFKTRKKALFIIIFTGLHCLIINNFILLSNDIINGDFSARNLIPLPMYSFMRVPDSPLAQDVGAVNRLAADFAQIYFPSQKFSSLNQAYTKETLDPWQRPSRYAPFIHAICSMSFCKLNYGYASFFHMAIQLLLFYFSFIYAFKILHLERYISYGILLVNFCLFLTPVGLSWFERGQFSLYVSLSYLWLLLGIINRNVLYLFLSAIFAYVKLTSFPFIFVVFILWVLNSKNVKELKQSILFALVFLLSIALFFLFYPEFGVHFIVGIIEQELERNPSGLSLARLLPKFLVKVLPFVLIILGYLHIKKFKNDFTFLIPYVVGCGVILITYPTLAFDYSVPCLFCFIPLVIYWSKHSIIHNHFRSKIKYLLPVFLIIASFSRYIIMLLHSDKIIILFYILSSLIFLLLSLFYPSKRQERRKKI